MCLLFSAYPDAVDAADPVDFSDMVDDPDKYKSLFYRWLKENDGEFPKPKLEVSAVVLQGIKSCETEVIKDKLFGPGYIKNATKMGLLA